MMENIHLRVSHAKKLEIATQAHREGLSITALLLAAVNDRMNGRSRCEAPHLSKPLSNHH